MYDTVIFRLTRNEVEGVDFLNDIAPILSPEGLRVREDEHGVYAKCTIDGLNAIIRPYQIRIDGSICKWYLGDNYQTMGRSDVRDAIEKLSDTLNLPMERAKVSRIDFGLTIPVKFDVSCYLNHLGELSRATRLEEPNTLYYSRRRDAERLCFYDKNREQREHRKPIPDLYRDKNVLRYEIRFKARLPSLLGVPKETGVTGAILFDETFYKSLFDKWHDAYQDIRKVNDITLNFDMAKTRRDWNRICNLVTISQYGGEVKTIEQIKDAQKRGILTAKQAFDRKLQVMTACKAKEGFTTPNEAIIELDKKIAEAARYYR